ncbi:MAG: hypothetical protein ACJ72J_06240 [Nitrososphaeraceae archaeon]
MRNKDVIKSNDTPWGEEERLYLDYLFTCIFRNVSPTFIALNLWYNRIPKNNLNQKVFNVSWTSNAINMRSSDSYDIYK